MIKASLITTVIGAILFVNSGSSTVVGEVTSDLEIEGLNPANQKKINLILCG